MGVFGGYLVGVVLIGVGQRRLLVANAGRVDWRYDVVNGVVKSCVFGVAVSVISTFEGYDAPPTAEGVSRATTRTVVTSALVILALDLMLTAVMLRSGTDEPGTKTMERKTIDLWFGAFVAAGFAALLVLALKVGNLGQERATQTYLVEARFDNIGGLKVRGPVRSAGVLVGRVNELHFDNDRFQASVTLAIDKRYTFPKDTTASILTSGLSARPTSARGGRRHQEPCRRRPHPDHAVGGRAGEADRPVPVQQGAGRAGGEEVGHRNPAAAPGLTTSALQTGIDHMLRKLLTLLAFSFAPALASAQEAPDALVKRVTDEVLAIIKADKDLQSGNSRKIAELARPRCCPTSTSTA
jgi:hypothetical protein